MLYLSYFVVLLILVGTIFITPFIALEDESDAVLSYDLYGITCHQKLSRSLCIFKTDSGFRMNDCVPQNGTYVEKDNELLSTERNGETGYKFPVCSRCISLYFAMLLGALLYPMFMDIKGKELFPPFFLIIAIVPLALDGTAQFLLSMNMLPFAYESTNAIRIATGFIAGFVSSFYIIPLLQHFRS